MAILGILVTLMVGAYQGIQRRAATNATKEMLAALNSALRAFYEDFGYYPWTSGAPEYMGDFEDYAKKVLGDFNLVASGDEAEWKEEELLYAALTARVRRGPYFEGGGAKTVLLGKDANRFLVFGDGWGRPIQYERPKTGSTLPFLYSYGPNGEDDGGEDEDDVSNYAVD